jgi:hypothetical protein
LIIHLLISAHQHPPAHLDGQSITAEKVKDEKDPQFWYFDRFMHLKQANLDNAGLNLLSYSREMY